MIDHVWTVVCSHAVIDTDSQNVSIHNVLEQINLTAELTPDLVIDIPYQIVSFWVRSDIESPAKGKSRIVLADPTGDTTVIAEMPIDLTQVERARHRMYCRGLRLTSSGRYMFQVELLEEGGKEWRRIASVPLRVVVTSPLRD